MTSTQIDYSMEMGAISIYTLHYLFSIRASFLLWLSKELEPVWPLSL